MTPFGHHLQRAGSMTWPDRNTQVVEGSLEDLGGLKVHHAKWFSVSTCAHC